jgi:hypothetical protein
VLPPGLVEKQAPQFAVLLSRYSLARRMRSASQRFGTLDNSSSAHEIDYQHNDSHNQEQMNEPAANVGCKSDQPEYKQNHDYRPQHRRYLLEKGPTASTENGTKGPNSLIQLEILQWLCQ